MRLDKKQLDQSNLADILKLFPGYQERKVYVDHCACSRCARFKEANKIPLPHHNLAHIISNE